MKRFTEKHYHGIDHYLLCSADCHADMDCVDCPAFENAVERLAAYEDTGLEPEQVEALKRTTWIPCSERLPKVGEEVLVYSSSRGVVADYYDRGIFGYGDVTHWMPLPELPKEDKNGRT